MYKQSERYICPKCDYMISIGAESCPICNTHNPRYNKSKYSKTFYARHADEKRAYGIAYYHSHKSKGQKIQSTLSN